MIVAQWQTQNDTGRLWKRRATPAAWGRTPAAAAQETQLPTSVLSGERENAGETMYVRNIWTVLPLHCIYSCTAERNIAVCPTGSRGEDTHSKKQQTTMYQIYTQSHFFGLQPWSICVWIEWALQIYLNLKKKKTHAFSCSKMLEIGRMTRMDTPGLNEGLIHVCFHSGPCHRASNVV